MSLEATLIRTHLHDVLLLLFAHVLETGGDLEVNSNGSGKTKVRKRHVVNVKAVIGGGAVMNVSIRLEPQRLDTSS